MSIFGTNYYGSSEPLNEGISKKAYNSAIKEKKEEISNLKKEIKAKKKNLKYMKKAKAYVKEDYTDAQLLDYLEENEFEPSYSNLQILREGLENGTIQLFEKEEVVEEEPADEEVKAQTGEQSESPDNKDAEEVIPEQSEAQSTDPAEAGFVRVSIQLPSDGSMSIMDQNKQITADVDGNVNVALAESLKYISTKNSERLLESFLLEDCSMKKEEFNILTEEEKTESIKDIIMTLLRSIQEKISAIDTTSADRSRGDIKQLRELSIIQDSLNQLETMIERDENSLPAYSQAIGIISKSLLLINRYTDVFKEAYRNKKTLMIMRYESLILSVISSVTYLVSTIVAYDSNGIHIKATTADILSFPPLVTLSNFIRSVDSGEFKLVNRDVSILREFYLEVPLKTMSSILEAPEYRPMVIDGIKNVLSNLGFDSGKLTNLLYKVAGIAVLLFSVRDVFYTLFKMKNKTGDMINALNNFVNINNGGNVLNKLSQFSKKFENDAAASTELSKREIEDENRELLSDIKNIKNTSNNLSIPTEPTQAVDTKSADNSEFAFDF